MEVARLGRDDCAVEKVPEALARLRPMGCVVEPPFLRPGFFRRFPPAQVGKKALDLQTLSGIIAAASLQIIPERVRFHKKC